MDLDIKMVLSYVVTILGIVLCVFSMALIVAGKRLPGDKGKAQVIKFKQLEIRTNAVITLLIVSVVVAVAPLAMLFYTSKEGEGFDKQGKFFIVGRVEDESGRSLEGATAKVVQVDRNGKAVPIEEKTIGTDGAFDFKVSLDTMMGDNNIRLETDKPGYRKQTIIMQLKQLNVPAVLIKSKGNE